MQETRDNCFELKNITRSILLAKKRKHEFHNITATFLDPKQLLTVSCIWLCYFTMYSSFILQNASLRCFSVAHSWVTRILTENKNPCISASGHRRQLLCLFRSLHEWPRRKSDGVQCQWRSVKGRDMFEKLHHSLEQIWWCILAYSIAAKYVIYEFLGRKTGRFKGLQGRGELYMFFYFYFLLYT